MCGPAPPPPPTPTHPGGKLSPVHAAMWLLARGLQDQVEELVPGLRPTSIRKVAGKAAAANGTAATAAASSEEPDTVRLIHPKRRAAQLAAAASGGDVSAKALDDPTADGGCVGVMLEKLKQCTHFRFC